MRHVSRRSTRALVAHVMQEETPFFPRGAIAFFAAMMVVYALFWLLIAAVMVSRG